MFILIDLNIIDYMFFQKEIALRTSNPFQASGSA